MNVIERQIEVSYRHQILFTKGLFVLDNDMFCDTLVDRQPDQAHKVLIVMDEALCRAQPDLIEQIKTYCSLRKDRLHLVCEPMQFEGGERTKNSYFHVSEIQSKIEMHHIDRHSYVVAIGGGAGGTCQNNFAARELVQALCVCVSFPYFCVDVLPTHE